MLTEVNYIDRLNGISLYYNGLNSYYQQQVCKNSSISAGAAGSSCYYPITPPYTNGYDYLMPISEDYQKFYAPESPPQSPTNQCNEKPKSPETTTQRTSVIMKVENSQVKPIKDLDNVAEEIVCKWINCYR